jgi:hypothetical protein
MENETLDPIALREQEVAQYEQNISMYKAIALSLPSEWPEHLLHLKNSPDQHRAIAQIESIEDVELVSDLWAHDAAEASVRSEMVELAKSKAILAVLEAQAE